MRLQSSLLFALALPVGAQQPGITFLPDSVVQRIDRTFSAAGGDDAPGCALGISRDGKPVLTRAYGLANLELAVPNTPETIFESGSVAKQFTAAAMLLLAADGKLSLEDDIRKYLPEMQDFGKTITIRNLLTHTSGLRDWYGLADFKDLPAGTHVHSPATVLELARHQKTLNFVPGAEYLYSNTGYILASIIVQRVSGKPFATFSKERIFTPLGMTHTQWRDDFNTIVKGRATAYTGSVKNGWKQDMPFSNVVGSGGLLTTVGDWLTWNAFLDNPTTLPGGDKLVQAMTTRMTLNSGKQIAYALGVSVTSREGMREISHSGSTGGYRTWLARYPDEHASIAVLCNGGESSSPTAWAQAALLATLGRARKVPPPPVAVHVPVESLRQYAGMYVGPTPETILTFMLRDTALVADVPGKPILVPTGPDRFRLGGNEVLFDARGSGAHRFRWITATDTSEFRATPAVRPDRKQLAVFAGSYRNDELDTRLRVVARDSTLVIHQGTDSTVYHQTFADTFSSDNGTIQFTRKKGLPSGFGFWAGRVRNIYFGRER